MPAGRTVRSLGDQALAYAIAERARLACEALLEETEAPRDLVLLGAAHRGLGLAGYLASEGLAPATRREVLQLVHDDEPVPLPPARTAPERILVLALHGREAVRRCAREPVVAAAMALAARSCREALDPLARLVGEDRAEEIVSAVEGGRYSEVAWQRAHLAGDAPADSRATASADRAR